MPQRQYRHLALVPDLEPVEVKPSEPMRAMLIEPPGLTAKQRALRKERMRKLGVAVERFRQPGESS